MDFQAMPVEIIHEVAGFVSIPRKNHPHHPDQTCLGTQDLLSLMSCSRRLHEICEVVLYRRFLQNTSKAWSSFIRNIINRPELAKHVQHVNLTFNQDGKCEELQKSFTVSMFQEMYHHLVSQSLNGRRMQLRDETLAKVDCLTKKGRAETAELSASESIFNESPSSSHPARPNPELQLIQPSCLGASDQTQVAWHAFRNTSHPEEAILQEIISYIQTEGNCRALSAYTLSRFTNIKSLAIEVVSYASNNKLDELFKYAISPKGLEFRDLRKLSISYKKRDEASQIDHFLPLMGHQSLKSFTGDHLQQVSRVKPSPEAYCELFSFTSLTLLRSNLSPSALDSLLRSCPNLTYLKYEHDRSRGDHRLNPRMFSKYIENLKDKLEELVLYRANCHNQLWEAAGEEFTIINSSLKQFQILKSLAITANLLLGPQKSKASHWYLESQQFEFESQSLILCLPKSLERLELKECGENIVQNVRELVELCPMEYPNLKEIVLCYKDFTYDRYFGGFEHRVWRRDTVHRGLNMCEIDILEETCGAKGIVLDVQFD